MKIVRHVARDMRGAMRAIRERLGEDAVILSSRRVPEGVELTAAIDFDATMLQAQTLTAQDAPLHSVQDSSGQRPAAPAPAASAPPAAMPGWRPAVQSPSRQSAYPDEPHAVGEDSLHMRTEVRAALLEPAGPAAVPQPASAQLPASTPGTAQMSYAAQPSEMLGEVATLVDAAQGTVTDAVSAELKNLRRMLETQLAQLAWNDMSRRAPVHTEVLRELSEIGIAAELASHITDQLPADTELTRGRRFAIAALSQYLHVTGDRWLENGGRIAFIGATGIGKTTTLAKLAVKWVLRHGPRELALIAADGTRLGAQDQMQSLGQLLGAPVYTPQDFPSLPALLSRLQQRLILIDTPGSSLRDTQLSGRLAVLASSASQLQTALVLGANTQAGALEETVQRFAPAHPGCCVLTKIDEAVSLGGALSVLIRARLPISYVSEGQRIPEDLRPARALALVADAVRLARNSGAAADEDLLRRRFGKVAHAIA